MLVQCAWSAIRKKDSYLRSKYYHLVSRIGKKKALIAIAHKILKSCYHVLKNQEAYKDLGTSHLEKNSQDKLLRYYTKKIVAMGFNVEPNPMKNLAQA